MVEREGAPAVGGARLIVHDRQASEEFFVGIFGVQPGRVYLTDEEIPVERRPLVGDYESSVGTDPRPTKEGQMSRRRFEVLVTVIAIGWLAPALASGQGQAQDGADVPPAWTVPRTPDGRPDLQGFWTTQTFTPLERPEHLAGQEFFTEEEANTLRQQLTAEGVDPSASGAINLEDAEAGTTCRLSLVSVAW